MHWMASIRQAKSPNDDHGRRTIVPQGAWALAAREPLFEAAVVK
jgi:hypothetical protein